MTEADWTRPCGYRTEDMPNFICTRPVHEDGTTHIYAWHPPEDTEEGTTDGQ